MLNASGKIVVKVNGNTTGTPLVGTSNVYAAFSTSITQVVVTNSSSTDVVSVSYIATD